MWEEQSDGGCGEVTAAPPPCTSPPVPQHFSLRNLFTLTDTLSGPGLSAFDSASFLPVFSASQGHTQRPSYTGLQLPVTATVQELFEGTGRTPGSPPPATLLCGWQEVGTVQPALSCPAAAAILHL